MENWRVRASSIIKCTKPHPRRIEDGVQKKVKMKNYTNLNFLRDKTVIINKSGLIQIFIAVKILQSINGA
jgi:hypothetical protein